MPRLPVLNCDDCGACCRRMGHPPFFWSQGSVTVDEQWIAMPVDLQNELQDYLDALEEPTADVGEPCFWLDDQGRCKHYDFRPGPCRDVQVDSHACRAARAEFGI